jgi:hypothetical protein
MANPTAESALSRRACRLDVTFLIAVSADLILGAFASVMPIDVAGHAVVAITGTMTIFAAVVTHESAPRTLESLVTHLLAVAALDLFRAVLSVVTFDAANPAGVAL